MPKKPLRNQRTGPATEQLKQVRSRLLDSKAATPGR